MANHQPKDDSLLTIEQACALLPCSRETFYERCRAGRGPALVRVIERGIKRTMVRRADASAWVASYRKERADRAARADANKNDAAERLAKARALRAEAKRIRLGNAGA